MCAEERLTLALSWWWGCMWLLILGVSFGFCDSGTAIWTLSALNGLNTKDISVVLIVTLVKQCNEVLMWSWQYSLRLWPYMFWGKAPPNALLAYSQLSMYWTSALRYRPCHVYSEASPLSSTGTHTPRWIQDCHLHFAWINFIFSPSTFAGSLMEISENC